MIKLTRIIFVYLIIFALTTANVFAMNNCDNQTYRKTHPSECKYSTSDYDSDSILMWSGIGATVTGIATVLATNYSHGHTTSQNQYELSPDTIRNNRPSISSYAISKTNGNDIDQSTIDTIRTYGFYAKNYKQFDNIKFAWAYARGFTGKNSTINIIDDFSGTHGNIVYDITHDIAPNATINKYNIGTSNDTLYSYNDIANVISSSAKANIYNASWQIPVTDNQNAATAIYNQNSPKTYTEAQNYFYDTTSQNFITQIRNTAINNDAIFVWAAGNESANESGVLSAMPIAFPDLNGHFVNVVAVNNNKQIALYSNQCGITQNYCIAAPGSAWKTSETNYASGTSFATPVVSAAIATIREAFPYMSASQITELLFTTATDLGDPGVDAVYGWGLLDMEKATNPVGTPKIILANDTIQPLNTMTVSGAAAGAIKKANIKLAFFDDFGRAFTTTLSDNIHVIPYGRGFDRLRESDENYITLSNGIEFGFQQNGLLKSNGLISSTSNDYINFIGYKNTFNISNLEFYQQFRTGFLNPTADENSIASGFSTIQTQSIKTGIKWNDLSFEFAIPDQIISGNMQLYIPISRANDGTIIYNHANLDLTTKPSTEYTIKYNNFSATYINNPDWQDEFFIMAKIKGTF